MHALSLQASEAPQSLELSHSTLHVGPLAVQDQQRVEQGVQLAVGQGEDALAVTHEGQVTVLQRGHLVWPGHHVGEAELAQLVALRHGDGEKLVVRSADPGTEYLETVIEPVVKREHRDGIDARPGDVWLDLVLSPEAPLGTLSGRVQVATNHPQAQTFGIQYLVRIRSVIETRPDGVRLWLLGSRDGEGSSNWIRVIHNQPGDFKITSLDVSHPEFFSAATLSNEPGRQQAVRVKLVEELTPEALGTTVEAWIEIVTDIQPETKIELPVLIAPTRAGTRRDFHTKSSEQGLGVKSRESRVKPIQPPLDP